MAPGQGGPKGKRWTKWALAIVLVASALALGKVLAPTLWPSPATPDMRRLDLLQSAYSEFAAKQYDRASAILDERAQEVTPTTLDWMLRARIAEAQGHPAQALLHLKCIPDSDSIAAQAWLKAGQIELARGHARAAEAAYHHALKLNGQQIQSLRELAYLYAIERRKAECDAQFRTLNRLIPLDYTQAFAWCQNYCWLWDVEGARKVLLQFVAADPTDRWSRLALATSYVLTSHFTEAERILAPLSNSDPDARTLRAQMAIERGEIEAAEDLLKNWPADRAGLNILRGRLELQRNDPRSAAACFREAVRQDPEDRDAIHGLGVALQSLGDPQAKEYLQFAARYDNLKRTIKESVVTIQTDQKLFYKLGEICESLDRRDEARVWYRLAIGRDPLDAQAQQGLTRLDPGLLNHHPDLPSRSNSVN
jgi:tetratricopeptide (TPR) repeat protein